MIITLTDENGVSAAINMANVTVLEIDEKNKTISIFYMNAALSSTYQVSSDTIQQVKRAVMKAIL